ncbi:DUF58 domain-containing protein [Fervidobacterium thailandense]|uniref:Uncharacterized protein n=1 Tax=Fervidobacterium thailandense TaxID=1008305 RepID=A0A1E3G1D1_9BACT|nr:DUF58 domain-containing protein [Fervidobacterium thailandense]ODN30059.1 hypothetical protein A4H02_07730 [Fervidobacterium thailandense]
MGRASLNERVVDSVPEKIIWVRGKNFFFTVFVFTTFLNILVQSKYLWLAEAVLVYLIIDYVTKLRTLKNVNVQVKASARVFENEDFRITFVFESPKDLCLIFSPPSILRKEDIEVTLKAGVPVEVVLTSSLGTRGSKKLGHYVLKVPLPGNIVILNRVEEIDSDIKVLPNMEEAKVALERILEALPVLKSKHKFAEDVTYIKDVREYNNEPLNRIHWKQSARYGKLMVKEFEYAGTGKIHLLVDLNLPGGIYSRQAWMYIRKKYEEDAIRATTGLIHHFTSRHEHVQLYISHAGGFERLDSKDPAIYFDYLADASGTLENARDTSELIRELIDGVQPVDTVIIISMFLSKREIAEIIRLRKACGRVVVLLMPYGYRTSGTKKFKTYYEVPPEVRELYQDAKMLRNENILVEVWLENISLNEGLLSLSET